MTNAGTLYVQIRVTGNADYGDYLSETYTVKMLPYDLGSGEASIQIAPVYYTGVVQRPAYTILNAEGEAFTDLQNNLKNGTNCTITYANNKNVTTTTPATITIAARGTNYKGSLTGTFEIRYLDTLEVATAPTGWVKKAVITAPDGYTISTSLTGTYAASISISAASANENGTKVTYYLKEKATGHITDAKTITVKVDLTAPVFASNTLTADSLSSTGAGYS